MSPIRVKKTRKLPQHHNSALSVKVGMRRWMVEQLGGHPMILDCFCAGGMLWDRAYDRTSSYVGLDLRQFNDERRTIVTDSLRYLRHADANLDQFDLFDLDAYGSPMEHLAAICQRIQRPKGKRVGFILTDGTAFNSRMNGTNHGLLHYIGVSSHERARVQADYHSDIIAMGITKALRTAGLTSVETRKAENTAHSGGNQGMGGGMIYIGILAEGA